MLGWGGGNLDLPAASPPMIEALEGRTMLSVTANITGGAVEGVAGTFAMCATTSGSNCGGCTASTLTNYTINWGDGSNSSGSFPANSTGYNGNVNHTYTEESPTGGYNVTFTANSTNGSGTGILHAIVTDGALSGSGVTVDYTPGQSFNGHVAHFTDEKPNESTGEFTTTIHWGENDSNGNPITSTGTVQSDGAHGFWVSGTHTYSVADGPGGAGTDMPVTSLLVDIVDRGGSTTSATSQPTTQPAQVNITGSFMKGQVATNGSGNVNVTWINRNGKSLRGLTVSVTSQSADVKFSNNPLDPVSSRTLTTNANGGVDGDRLVFMAPAIAPPTGQGAWEMLVKVTAADGTVLGTKTFTITGL